MLKSKLFISLFFISFFVAAQNELIQITDFGKNKGNLKMYAYIPTNLDQNKSIALIIVAHGCTQSAKLIASETGWNKLADSLNLIVIYPEQKQINNAAKCFNFYLGFKAKKDKGEVASIKKMIDFSIKNYLVDSSKIFITGFSAGGGISNAMLNAYPQLFNAGALFAAPSNLFKPNILASELQPKVAIIQGDKDMVVPKGNAKRIIKQWVTKNKLVDSNYTLKQDYLDNPLLTAKQFYDTNKQLKIVHLTVKDLKHKIMVKPGSGIKKGGKLDFHTVDINFHSTYWVAHFFGLIKSPPALKTSSLPKLSITVDAANLNFSDHINATTSYYNTQKNAEFKDLSFKIKYRGNASGHYDKKNYSLKFPKKTCFNDTPYHKKWKLNAEYIDKTLMRNKLSYDLFRLFSLGNLAPTINYVSVNINNNYEGIYALTERVDNNFLHLNKNDTNAVLFKQPPISYPPEEHEKRYTDFIAFSKWNKYYKPFSERAMEKLLSQVYYNQRFPSIKKSDKTYLIHDVTSFIFNSKNEEFTDNIIFNQYFDLNNIIDWHLLLLISKNQDGLIKNFFIYKEGTNKPFKFCPWDYDHSYGRDGGGGLNIDSEIDCNRVILLKRLLETNAFNYKQKLLDKFLLLKEKDILTSININRMIDKNVSLLGPFVQENEKRWPPEEIEHFKTSNFYSEVTLIKKWTEKRLPIIEIYLKELQAPDKTSH